MITVLKARAQGSERVVKTPGKPKRTRLSRLMPPLGLLVLVLGAWEALSASLPPGRAYLLPPPQSVLLRGLLARDAYTEILPSFVRTALLSLGGFAVAILLGVVLVALMYRVRWLERAAFPYLVVLQAVPILAVAPLIAVAFGYSYFSKGIVVVLIALFPIPANFLLGLRSVDQGLIDLFRLRGASWWTMFRKLAVPASLPQLMTGLRISAGLSVIGAIVGEEFFQAGVPGLGMRLLQYLDQVEYNRLYGTLLLSSALGIAFYAFFTWLSRRLLANWHESAMEA